MYAVIYSAHCSFVTPQDFYQYRFTFKDNLLIRLNFIDVDIDIVYDDLTIFLHFTTISCLFFFFNLTSEVEKM